jgi:hypothetical protein
VCRRRRKRKRRGEILCVTYIFIGDAVANVVVSLGEGAVVA